MELLAREELAIHSVVNGSDDTSAEWATFYEEVMQHLFQDEEQAKKHVRKHEGVKLRIKMLQRLRAETIAADFDRWSAWQGEQLRLISDSLHDLKSGNPCTARKRAGLVKPYTVMTFGTFDLFHVGHLNMLQRAAQLGDRLVVGVSTDEFNLSKGKRSVISFQDRARIVRQIPCVDLVFAEEGMELKRQYFEEHGADLFVMGDDWEGKFDHLLDAVDVKYLLRTANVSSTDIKKTSHNHTEHKIKGDGKLTVTADPTADLRTPKSSADDASQGSSDVETHLAQKRQEVLPAAALTARVDITCPDGECMSGDVYLEQHQGLPTPPEEPLAAGFLPALGVAHSEFELSYALGQVRSCCRRLTVPCVDDLMEQERRESLEELAAVTTRIVMAPSSQATAAGTLYYSKTGAKLYFACLCAVLGCGNVEETWKTRCDAMRHGLGLKLLGPTDDAGATAIHRACVAAAAKELLPSLLEEEVAACKAALQAGEISQQHKAIVDGALAALG